MLDRIVANWPLKLLALALAFATWVVVTGEDRVVQDFSVPLVVQVPDDRVLTSAPPTNVTVRVRGTESQIRRLDPVLMSMQVALDDVDPGTHEVPLSRRQLGRIPAGVDVDFVDPDRLSLQVEERATAEVPIEPTFVGQPPDGYTFYGASTVPERVTIAGPRSRIEQTTAIHTGPIRLENRTVPSVVDVTLAPPGQYVQVVDDPAVTVRVDVDTDPVTRRLPAVPVRLEGQRWVTRLDPERVVVELSGPARLLERVVPDQVRAVADVSGVDPAGEAVPVDVDVRLVDVPVEESRRLTVASVTPSRTLVRVSPQRMIP